MQRFAVAVIDFPTAYQRVLATCRHGVISRTAAHRCGLAKKDIDRLVCSGEWQRLFHGAYLVDAYQLDEIPRLTWMSAALISHGPSAFLVGPTAAELYSFQGLPASSDVIWIGMLPTSSRHRRQRHPGMVPVAGGHGGIEIRVRQLSIGLEETTLVQGMRVTCPLRTLVDTALGLDRVHGLCVVDSALNLGSVTLDEVRAAVDTCHGRPGVRLLRDVLPLADARAQSPLETRIRLACIDGGVAPDDLQYPIRNGWGTLLGLGDLAWWRGLRRPLVAEADGVGPHSLPQALFRDRFRANDFTLADVDMLRFTWADAARHYYVSGMVRQALARAAA